jgi:hypothetical protein
MEMYKLRNDQYGVSACVLEFYKHVHQVAALGSDDNVTQGAVDLCDQLMGIALSLANDEMDCACGVLLANSRLDTFVKEKLEPWVLKTQGASCSDGARIKIIGKA